MDFTEYKNYLKQLKAGKRLPDALYIELQFFRTAAPSILFDFYQNILKTTQLDARHNVIKLFTSQFKLSLLQYKSFWDTLHPELEISTHIDLSTGKVRQFNYRNSSNPPILHRKENLIDPEHPEIEKYLALTQAEEQAGLYANPRTIGFKKNWETLLHSKGLSYKNHELIRVVEEKSQTKFIDIHTDNNGPFSLPKSSPMIQRHKTAISRRNFSKPVQTLLEYNFLNPNVTFFDYGCGQGDDLQALKKMGMDVQGWDPVFNPSNEKRPSDIVNLGFVINVIEDPIERVDVLHQAFDLTKKVLVVSVMLIRVNGEPGGKPYKDGVITQKGTFQKYFTQNELAQYLEDVLNTSAIAVGPGIFYVFKEIEAYQDFLSRRSRKEIDWNELSLKLYPDSEERRKARRETLYQENQDLFEAFWKTMLDIGRLPKQSEFSQYDEIKRIAGSFKAAKRLFIDRYGKETLDQAFEIRKNDLLVYLALSNFQKKIPFKNLSIQLQTDIKTFTGGYRNGLEESKRLLFEMGKPGRVEKLCHETSFGIFDHKALYFHRSLISRLHPVLRIMVGCAEMLYSRFKSIKKYQ
ncbi:DNA phosphorothioation-associated putative methyltransferase [Desulfobacter latus]|uniref:DNA phosphorothioation-associated putative methyltransferase n=1 Tax=Desulfobacter latus TaxID=2292 RepID=A0A850SZ73_9BACT|nr:DNA phosphorothioation-associated putative methyltransferase [Desulfobacter latus]NWH04733.1 DNA phosphorothioation-associated putative methyltransferase [Desulfobacter latus]